MIVEDGDGLKISNRQQQILAVLLDSQGDITAREISEEIKVSSRTVYRELLELEPILETAGISLQKKSGIGIQIHATPQQLESFKKQLFATDTSQYSIEERKVLILCMLLESNEPLKLFSLSSSVQATTHIISGDLDKVDQWLYKSGLILVRRRGYGVEIQGSEENKRQAICQLAFDYLDNSELFGRFDDNTDFDVVNRKLLFMIGKANFFQIERALWKLEEQYPTSLPELEYTRLLIRLSVAVTRIQQGFIIQPDHASSNFKSNTKINYFSECLQLHLPPQEEAYLSHLLEAWEQGQEEKFQFQEYMQLTEKISRLIKFVEEQVAVPLSQDGSLKEGLLNHIVPFIRRISEGGTIRNPLLSLIKRNYDALFGIVKEGANKILDEAPIPDEEIGFLVMHFGAAVERSKQSSPKVRALLVCTSGIGSAKLLAVRVSKELPQIKLIDHVSWFEAARIPEEAYDLIISTVDLPLPPEQYIKLSPLLTAEEVEKLLSFIQANTLKKQSLKFSDKPFIPTASSLEKMRNMKQYFDQMIRLIDGFEIYRLQLTENEVNLESVLDKIQDYLTVRKNVGNAQVIIRQLREREKQGSQIIPDTETALFHTRSEHLPEPVLTLFHLEYPFLLEKQPVKHVLLMLGQKDMPKQTLEILSEVSSMLLLPEMIDVLKTGDEEAVKHFISQRFSEFTKIKFERGANS